jgi:hypothetical protein
VREEIEDEEQEGCAAAEIYLESTTRIAYGTQLVPEVPDAQETSLKLDAQQGVLSTRCHCFVYARGPRIESQRSEVSQH